jgi:hypothetical protein
VCIDRTVLWPGAAAALARSFSGAAAPAGQPEQPLQQPAIEAEAGHASIFKVIINVRRRPGGPSPEQTAELASLGQALAAFAEVDLKLYWMGRGCPAAARALLQPVAARLVAFRSMHADSAGALLGALQQLELPRLARLRLKAPEDRTPSAVATVAGLHAPRLATVSLQADHAGSSVVAAVIALAAGRAQPVGPDGRPVGLTVAVSKTVLDDEELWSVCEEVAAVRGLGIVTVRRLCDECMHECMHE